ncbi:MAG: L-seryl-tRNA(Sec) selenium transferase [Acidobacteriota bacterium]|nr:L-seryl-tRNA(Sec) selenium transferase [Acidobacteriota bacterium]
MKDPDPRAAIPPVNDLVEHIRRACPGLTLPHELAVRAARLLAARLRKENRFQVTESDLEAVVGPLRKPGPAHVINATGILLHTNQGRAPLDRETVMAALDDVAGYTNLEMNLKTGKRGHRDVHFATLARLIWDVEDATLVNNAAAAVALVLSAVGGGGETVVSRGELIEIGGSFRLPDIMNLAGTTLVEVGTTNKTKPDDYADAVTERTACFLKTHTSNYRIEGFTREVTIAELTALGRKHKIPVIMDLGSGLSQSLEFPEVPEPFIEDYLKARPDLLIFSGDKLFGGVQAGIILGAKAAIQKLRKHPMMRMLRCDKLSISIACHQLVRTVTVKQNPFSRLASTEIAELETRAEKIAAAVPELALDVFRDQGYIGGGSLPQEARPSVCLSCASIKPDALAFALRTGNPPVVGYIREERFILNMASVFPEEDEMLIEALKAASHAARS